MLHEGTAREVPIEERRARLGRRHRLAVAERATDPVAVAASLVALHGTDPSSVYVGTWARMKEGSVAEVERALYTERSLLRLLAMRRTVFVTPVENAPILQHACSHAVAARERRTTLGRLADAGVRYPERLLAEAEEAALRALHELGEASAAEVAAAAPVLGQQVVLGRGKKYETRQNIASRVLLLLAAEGRAVRGRPRGSWTSHQHQWSPIDRWLPGGLPELPAEQARAALAREWLGSFGPGTVEDLQWWTGWSKTQTRQALTAVDAVAVGLEGGGTGYLLPGDLEPEPPVEPWAALLPGLDSTPMGWRGREWYLGPHGPRLFDRAGNVGPTLWWGGRIVGGWAQDSSGEIVIRFLEDAGAEAEAAARAEAERLATRLGGVRLSARTRGRTWLEEELAG